MNQLNSDSEDERHTFREKSNSICYGKKNLSKKDFMSNISETVVDHNKNYVQNSSFNDIDSLNNSVISTHSNNTAGSKRPKKKIFIGQGENKKQIDVLGTQGKKLYEKFEQTKNKFKLPPSNDSKKLTGVAAMVKDKLFENKNENSKLSLYI